MAKKNKKDKQCFVKHLATRQTKDCTKCIPQTGMTSGAAEG